MELIHSSIQYLQENILFNPLVWGIVGVILWIVGAAFIKGWRGKGEE